ncbi:MAG: hypothetical protein ACLFR0_03885 [Alphaproteobacteria bacterium]
MVHFNKNYSDNPEDPVLGLDAFRRSAISEQQEAQRRCDVDAVSVARAKKNGDAVPLKRSYGDAVRDDQSAYARYQEQKIRNEVDARLNGGLADEGYDDPWDSMPSDCNPD